MLSEEEIRTMQEIFRKVRQSFQGEAVVWPWALDGIEIQWLYDHNIIQSGQEKQKAVEEERIKVIGEVKDILIATGYTGVFQRKEWQTLKGGK